MDDYLGTEAYQKAIEEFLAKVKFNCDFKDNVCICQRVDGTPLAAPGIPCCCGQCAYARGYLSGATRDEFWFSHYQDKFDEHLGFYRKGIGCILERKFRSAICNTYICEFLCSGMFRDEEKTYCLARNKFDVFTRRSG